MRKTFTVVLKGGAKVKVKAETFKIKWNNDALNPYVTEWEAIDTRDQFVFFIPTEIVAVVG